ncbi:hypothetical protein ACVET5_000418 [Listeria monocytogenes]
MLDDIKDALKVEPVPAKSGSVEYINPNIKTSVFVNPPPKKHLIFYKINLVNLITKAGEDKSPCYSSQFLEDLITLYNKNPAIFKIAGFLPNWRITSPPE